MKTQMRFISKLKTVASLAVLSWPLLMSGAAHADPTSFKCFYTNVESTAASYLSFVYDQSWVGPRGVWSAQKMSKILAIFPLTSPSAGEEGPGVQAVS